MKKLLKILSCNLMLIFCVLISGCSCSSPMNVVYKVTYTNENGQSTTSSLLVNATVTRKYREPASTPCYKKIDAKKYVKLETASEIAQCFDSDCYKVVKKTLLKKEYGLIDRELDVIACQRGEFDCFEYSKVEYYKLLEDSEGIDQCYTEDGEYFEKATYNKVEKMEVESKNILSTSDNKLEYTSESLQISSNEVQSLIYEFEIRNKESHTIKIAAIDLESITEDSLKKESYSKIKFIEPEKHFENNKYYYFVGPNSTIKISIEIKNLLKSDAKTRKTKNLTLNIPIIVK